jgi:hypothetical protein
MLNANEAESGLNLLLNFKLLNAPILSKKVEIHFFGRKIIPKNKLFRSAWSIPIINLQVVIHIIFQNRGREI